MFENLEICNMDMTGLPAETRISLLTELFKNIEFQAGYTDFEAKLTQEDRRCIQMATEYFRTAASDLERAEVLNNVGAAIKYIGDSATAAERLLAIKNNGMVVEHLAPTLTKQERAEAVQQNGCAIRYFTGSVSKEECLQAVKSNGYAIADIPSGLLDKEICCAALESNPWTLSDIPEHLLDAGICQFAIECGHSLEFVPEAYLNYEMCVTAVKNNADYQMNHMTSAEEHIPSKFLDEKLIELIGSAETAS